MVFFVHDIEASEYKALRRLLKVWKEYLHERFGKSRLALMEDPENVDVRARVEEDRHIVDGYKMVSRLIEDSLSKGYKLRVVTQASSGQPQAIGSFSSDETSLEVQDLLTAPWNLHMHGENDDSHKPLVVKGSGTVLMHSFYTKAQELGVRELCLKPSSEAFGYYAKLGMTWDEARKKFFFPISRDCVPAKLDDILNHAIAKP